MLLSKVIQELKRMQQNKGDIEIEKITSQENFDQVIYNEETAELEFYFMPF